MKQILEKDYSPGFLLKTPSKQCSSANEQNQHILSSRGENWGFKHPKDLENFLREHEEFSGFSASPLISHCLSKSVSLSEDDRGQSHQINLPKALPEEDHFLATGEYYFTLKRIQEALRNDIEDLAAIDGLVGEDALLGDVSCRGLQFTQQALSECDELKKCSPEKGDILQAGQETLVAMQALERIDKELKNLSNRKNKKEIEGLKQRKEAIKALYPWIVGVDFKSGYDPDKIQTKEQMAELIIEQLRKNREKLKNQFEERKSALNCVSGMSGRDCSSGKVARTISKTPALSVKDIFGNLSEKDSSNRQKFSRESLVQNNFFSEAICRQKNRGLIKEQRDEAVLGLVDTLGVIGTMGLGSAFLAARIASRAGGLSNRVRAYQAAGLLTADTLFSTPYMKEAYDICAEDLNKLERTESEALSSDNICKSFPVRTKLTRDSRNCIFSATLASLPITMPIMGLLGGSALRQARQLTAKRTLAEASLKRTIDTREAVDALQKAHRVGAGRKGKDGTTPARIGNYTQAQLAEKNRILQEAGFTPAEIRKLMEDGVVGVKVKIKKALQVDNVGRDVNMKLSDNSVRGLDPNKSPGSIRELNDRQFNLWMSANPGQVTDKLLEKREVRQYFLRRKIN